MTPHLWRQEGHTMSTIEERLDQQERWIHQLAYCTSNVIAKEGDLPNDYVEELVSIGYNEAHLSCDWTPPCRNPAPVIETANGAVDMEPNPAHHTTRRIAELEEVVAALNESNNALLHNQGIHEAAIAELHRRMEADIRARETELARVHRGYQKLADAGQWDESLTELTRFTPSGPPVPPHPTPPASELDYESSPDDNSEYARAIRWSITWECRCGQVSSVFSEARYVRAICPECDTMWEVSPSFCDSTPYVAEKGEGPHDHTPPAAPDEDALWEQVVSAWARAMGNHPHPVDARGVRADVYAAKAAVAKAVELGLVPTPMPSDEELATVCWDAVKAEADRQLASGEWNHHDHDRWERQGMAQQIAGIRAVREAIAAAQPVTVPEIPEGWRWVWMQVFYDPSRPGHPVDHYEAKIERISGADSSATWRRVDGTGPTWQEALVNAIAATGEWE